MTPTLQWLAHTNRKVLVPFAICLGFAGLLALLYYFRFGSVNGTLWDLDGYQLNFNVQLGRKTIPDPRLYFLTIDRNTYRDDIGADEVGDSTVLANLRGTFPWSRAVWAAVIERLMEAHARLVIIDLLFPAPGPGDEELHAAMEKYGDRVILASNIQSVDKSDRDQIGNEIRVTLPSPSILGTPEHPTVSAQDPRVGYVSVWPNDDGIIRKAHFFQTPELLMGRIPAQLPKEFPDTMYSLAGRAMQKLQLEDRLPDTWEGQTIRFSGPPTYTFEAHSLYEIFIPRMWASPNYQNGEVFRDKIVLVGPAANWSHDEHLTPFPKLMSGPEVHLNILAAALQNEFLRESHRTVSIVMIVLAGFLAFGESLTIRNPYIRVLGGIGTVAGLLGGSLFAYNYLRLNLPVGTPALAFFGGLMLTLAYEIVREQYERSRLRGVLDRYMSKDLVKDVLENPNSYFSSMGGVRRPVAILFSDVRGFTTISEGADPTFLVKQLNEYLAEMVKIVFHNYGTIDKFIGDAVMAVWGNVVSGGPEVDAQRAVRTGLEMRAGLVKLNADWRSRAMMELSFGIGINHGEVIVGNVGSDQKMEITVIGDAVNLASRLEGLTKEYQIDFLIGENVAELVEKTFYLQMADNVRVKGKFKPVHVYAVLGEKGPEPQEEIERFLREYHAGMELYKKGDFAPARTFFQHALELLKPNHLAKIYLDRCTQLLATPPTEWDGVYVMTKK
jgi:adenylate cyclase